MSQNQPAEYAPTSVSIARQPIFDEDRRVWGYALTCGDELLSDSSHAKPENTAICVAAGAYVGFQHILKQNQKIMLDFDETGIRGELPYALPPVRTAIQIDEHVFLGLQIPQILERLKSDGYLIAVRGFSGDRQFEPLYRLADIITVPVIDSQPAAAALRAVIQDLDARLLARRVDDAAGFEMCRQAGISLFEGKFFKHPDTITVRKMTTNPESRRHLLQCIGQPNPDIAELAESIQSDATISFRLLAYINATAFDSSQKVKSIHHAIEQLGLPKLRNWLRVVLANDMHQTMHAPELLQRSARRGKFLELVIRDHDFWGFDPESLHLLGLFSQLDILLGTSMVGIVTSLPIQNKLKRALRQEPGNEYLPLIQLAQCFEEARWEEAEAMMRQLNLNRDKVNAAFKVAGQWAGQWSSP